MRASGANESTRGTTQHNMRYKALAATPQERKHGAWLGGSILGSLGSFHELYVSKAEWEEQGASALERKCP